MKRLITINMAVFAMVAALALSVAMPVYAAANLWGDDETKEAIKADISVGGDATPTEIAIKIINIMLGFLGLIAVVIILLGGFKWMTAGGSEDKVGEAKKLMVAGLIGLIIILSSWGLAIFVIDNLMTATGGGAAEGG